MDQYFHRIQQLSQNENRLPPRIRFMLEEIMDLRANQVRREYDVSSILRLFIWHFLLGGSLPALMAGCYSLYCKLFSCSQRHFSRSSIVLWKWSCVLLVWGLGLLPSCVWMQFPRALVEISLQSSLLHVAYIFFSSFFSSGVQGVLLRKPRQLLELSVKCGRKLIG